MPRSKRSRWRSNQLRTSLVLGVLGTLTANAYLDLVPPLANAVGAVLVAVLDWFGIEGGPPFHWTLGILWLAVGVAQLIAVLGLPIALVLKKRPLRTPPVSTFDVAWMAWAVVSTLAIVCAVSFLGFVFRG